MSPLGHIVERCGESCCWYYMHKGQKNQYTTAIRFNKNTFPEEMFEKCKEEIRKMGMSQNEFFITKLKELIKDKGE